MKTPGDNMKSFILILFAITVGVSTLTAEDTYDLETQFLLDTEVGFRQGLLFNQSWDPQYNRGNLIIKTNYHRGSLILGAGLEIGALYTGFYTFFPLEIGVVLLDSEKFCIETSASLLTGMLLHRPSPYFLIGTEAAARFRWLLSENFSLTLTAGPRYFTSPAYGKALAPLEMIDFHIRMGAGLKFF